MIAQAIRRVLGEIGRAGRGDGDGEGPRTDRDLPMKGVLLGVAVLAVVLFAYFRLAVLANQPNATTNAFVSLGITMGIAFLFAAVSAWAIAMISTTPISGMTLTTLIIASITLSLPGMIIGETALSFLGVGLRPPVSSVRLVSA